MLEKDCQRKLTFEKVFFKDFDFIFVKFVLRASVGCFPNWKKFLPLKTIVFRLLLFFFYFQSSIVHINIVYRQTTLLRELPLMETGCLNIFSSRFSPPDPQFTSVCRQISFSVSIKFVKNNGRRSIRKKKFIKKKRIRKALSKFLTKNSEREKQK